MNPSFSADSALFLPPRKFSMKIFRGVIFLTGLPDLTKARPGTVEKTSAKRKICTKKDRVTGVPGGFPGRRARPRRLDFCRYIQYNISV